MKYSYAAGVFLSVFLSFSCVNAQSVDYAEIGEKGIQAFAQGNLIQAMDLLDQAAQEGYAPAQSTLAYILDKADDDERAFKLFQQAAEQNHAAGQYGLGGMYAKGEGVEKNPGLAGEWIKKSAMQSYQLAMRDLAHALEKGELGFEPDISGALRWFNECSDAGDTVCKRRLAIAYSRGDLGLAVNEARAKQFFKELNTKQEVE
jgi:hypothetical protein